MVGASLPVTVRTKFEDAVFAPSLTVIVILEVPLAPAIGVIVTVLAAPVPANEMLATGTRLVLDDEALSAKLFSGVSASPMVKEIGSVAVPSAVDCGPIAEIVGSSLVVTVNSKSVEVVLTPSLTVIVIVADPLWPEAGVSITFLAPPLPPKVMLAFVLGM